MPHSRLHVAALSFIITLLLFSQAATTTAQDNRNTSQARADISFTVSMSKPHTHLLEVEMRLRRSANAPGQVDLVMPVWTPGSYLIREYARHVQDFAAKDAQEEKEGRQLAWRKTNKNTWRVETNKSRDVSVTYRVYANELTVRTSELNDRHAFITPAALLMFPAGQLKAPSTVRIVPSQPDWKVATGLPEVPGEPNTFRAENFDVLYDSPIEVGTFKTLSFDVKNIPHRIVIDGEGNYDPEHLRRDVQKIVEAAVEMMGDIPYRDYTFILHLRPSGGGGLEHLNSTALGWRRHGFGTPAEYRDFLTLVAHEFFHLWNVKRIRPDALGPFDYSNENYTKLLWVAEGLTSYYENLLVRRAGLMTDKEFLNMQASMIQSLQNTPGRLALSLEEASFDAWIKYYRQDENSVNSQISYYDKGAIVGMLLDLEIRKRSNGAKSLDDVMRYLYTEFSKKGRNYTPEVFERASEKMAGSSLDDFFSRYVRGRSELDYNAALSAVGLQLETTGATSSSTPLAEKVYLGADLCRDSDRLTAICQDGDRLVVVRRVLSGTSAYEQGLNAGDQIVALDGMRVTRDSFNARLAEKKPGDTVRLTIFRFDDLRNLDIKLGGRIDANYRILPVAQPSAEQQRLYQGWLGAPLKQ